MDKTYRKLFKDNRHELEFSNNGYFISNDCVSEKDLDDLQVYFCDLFKGISLKEGFSTPFDYFDISKRFEIHNFICSKLNNLVDALCLDCEIYLANYLIKTPEKTFQIDTHQDWSYVDETKYRSFNIWIPLDNTTIENGAMVVVPKSHFKNIPTYRTPVIPLYFDKHKNLIYDYLVPIILNKKDIVVFDNSIIHGATSNNTQSNRIAVVLCIKPKEVNLQFLYPDKEHKFLEVYRQEDDFVFHFKNYLDDIKHTPVQGRKTGEINTNTFVKELREKEIIHLYQTLGIKANTYFKKYKQFKNGFYSLFGKFIKKIYKFPVF